MTRTTWRHSSDIREIGPHELRHPCIASQDSPTQPFQCNGSSIARRVSKHQTEGHRGRPFRFSPYPEHCPLKLVNSTRARIQLVCLPIRFPAFRRTATSFCPPSSLHRLPSIDIEDLRHDTAIDWQPPGGPEARQQGRGQYLRLSHTRCDELSGQCQV